MTDNVIQLGELRILQQEKRRAFRDDRCRHTNTTWDGNGDIITCDDCKMQISPVWMLHMLVEHYNEAMRKLASRERSVAEDKAHNLHLIAARKVEAVWRSRTMVPCCPHCGHGILPEDQLGARQMGKKFEIARRTNEADKKLAGQGNRKEGPSDGTVEP